MSRILILGTSVDLLHLRKDGQWREEDRNEVICFIQRAEGGRVLIDVSKNVEDRRRQLETHYGRPLVILATIPGGPEEEREIKDRFSHLKTEEVSIFYPGEDLMEFIRESRCVEGQQWSSRSTNKQPRTGHGLRRSHAQRSEKKIDSKASPVTKRRTVEVKTGFWHCGASTKEDGHPCRNRVAFHAQRCWVHK